MIVVALGLSSCVSARPMTALDLAITLNAFSDRTFPEKTPPIAGDSHAYAVLPLVGVARARGIRVVIKTDLRRDLWGFYSGETHTITINGGLSLNGQVATLIHELGHAMEPPHLNDLDGQVFAEALSYVVCKRLGLDIWRSTFTYLQGSAEKQARIAATLRKHGDEIDAAAALLIGAIHHPPLGP